MSKFAVEHVKRVHSVVHDRIGSDRIGSGNRITRSWIRCLNEYQLNPDSCAEPEVVAPSELQERQERLADVQAVAKVEMANLYQQLAGSGYAIMLTDREGVLLNYFGDPAFTHAASKTGLMQGAVWSERVQGTNGMGTCLVERRPITVHQDEHYLSRNIGLSCAAAPIFDHGGELVGVLDASGESRLAQQHTLALVSMSVQMIENRVFLQQFRHDFILRFHNRPEFVGTLSEGAIALSVTGTVLAASRAALALLGYTSPAEIVGRDICELFNITFSGLVDSSVRRAYHPVPIFEVRGNARFFAVVYQPVATTGTRRPQRAENPPAPPAASCARRAAVRRPDHERQRRHRQARHGAQRRRRAAGRNRHRQGTLRTRDALVQQPRHPSLRRDQLRLDSRIPGRKRTVRLPRGRLHRRQQGRAARQAVAGEWRHPVPR